MPHDDGALGSRRLWSVWEMIDLKLKLFLGAEDILNYWSYRFSGRGALFPEGVGENEREEMIENIKPLVEQLRGDEFALCRKAGDRLVEILETDETDPTVIAIYTDDLRLRLLDQGELMQCLWLSPSEVDRYEPRTPLFGSNFQTKFSSGGTFELDEAAKCLALGRATASVFHLSRPSRNQTG